MRSSFLTVHEGSSQQLENSAIWLCKELVQFSSHKHHLLLSDPPTCYSSSEVFVLSMISGFHCGASEIFTLLGCDTA